MPDLSSSLSETEFFYPVNALGRPIFRQDLDGYTMFYTPGALCVVEISEADRFENLLVPPEFYGKNNIPEVPESVSGTKKINQFLNFGSELWRYAERALAHVAGWREKPFQPESITLFMNNECNLHCIYCHTDPSRESDVRLDKDIVSMAAEMVAITCKEKGLPLLAVFHGGGEPTLHRERVDHALTLLRSVASAHDIALSTYVATNGVMSEEKARWLSSCFDLVGLSCDGPDDMHDGQRVLRGGRPTSRILKRTAHILREEGCRIHVRTTITDETFRHQAGIAEYICRQFSPEEIHFEPVYLGGRRKKTFIHIQAEEFVAHFLKARQIARQHNILLMSSGSRPNSIHGPYCNVFRSVLNIVPDGFATACFKISRKSQLVNNEANIGELNRDTGKFELDLSKIQTLSKKLDTYFTNCKDCFNRFHCSRECPDLCPLDDDIYNQSSSLAPGFRCQVQKAISYAIIREVAENLWKTRQTNINIFRIKKML